MASETTNGEIMLPVNLVRTIQETKFHVINGDKRYNALLERPWIHNMRVVPSMLHKVLKFPTAEGIKIVYGEQPAAKKMDPIGNYQSSIELGPKVQAGKAKEKAAVRG
ncbi:PREDICTED: uncharacterized protein LOC109217872 [Nicotiana attenuata]|uniref:uncharacterized protein LOC109217872 n=1 Tax=Nicotiana attenuata TaxID=49451 RepID=UPI000904C3AF|nr:PREDICTED: uncharacterized protein LOC109217872 [Nicotiana attenuata]